MVTAQNISPKKHYNWQEIGYKTVLLLPAFILLSIFMFYPIFETFRVSLTRSGGLGPEIYIGLQNYVRLFTNENFLAALIHALQWSFWSVVLQVPLAFFIAFSCVNFKTKIIKGLRGVYYLSNILPTTITAMLGRFLFMPTAGVIVTFAGLVGWNWLGSIDFLGNSRIVFWSIFGMATWAYTGFGIIYLMANIEQIPAELKEAALIDGANKWQYACHIVIPQVSYALRIQALLCIIGSIKLFDLPWLLTAGGPGNASTTLGIILYQDGFLNWQYGKGAAVGVVIFLLSLVFTVLQFSLQREE